ncbi:hypothetical protein ACFWWM_17630 [Streptomyces sp. NPDC058682]|uniref:hypothetical protein n=1 Tax=Streptomyces sp. NPDC058682 TaxID=3346596 RepID=UPI00364A2974
MRPAFGKPTLNAARTSLYVPAHPTFRNEGSISIFVVGTQWSATMWPSAFREKGTGLARWRDELGDFRYRSRIYRSSAVMNMPQAPDWAAMWWVIPKWRAGKLFAPGETVPSMQVHIARDPDSREVLSEDEQEPYGMKTRSTWVDQPVALLRRAAEKP